MALAWKLITVVPQRRKCNGTPKRRKIAEPINIALQCAVKVMCVTPTQGEATVTLGTVVVSHPPEFKRSSQPEIKCLVDSSSLGGVYRIADQTRI